MKTTLEKPRAEKERSRTKTTPKSSEFFDAQEWKDRFPSEPYTVDSDDFDDYEPAYRFGTMLRSEVDDFDHCENDIRKSWDSVKGDSRLDWDRARDAVRSAWESREPRDVTDPSASD